MLVSWNPKNKKSNLFVTLTLIERKDLVKADAILRLNLSSLRRAYYFSNNLLNDSCYNIGEFRTVNKDKLNGFNNYLMQN